MPILYNLPESVYADYASIMRATIATQGAMFIPKKKKLKGYQKKK